MVYFIKLILALVFAGIAILVVIALTTGSAVYWTTRDEYPKIKVGGANCNFFGFWVKSLAIDKKIVVLQDCGTTVSSPYIKY